MRRYIIAVFTVALFLFWTCLGFAQLTRSTARTGTSAAQFLKIGAGARPLGMAGAFTSLIGDINSIYWNPAGIARIYGGEATFNHASWLAETNYDFAAFALDLGEFGTVGASVISFRVPEDVVRTYQFPEGDGRRFDASSLALGVSYARNLTDRFSLGFTAKYIREQLWNETANGFAVDFGTLYITPFRDLRIGASITNFGTKMRLEGRELLFNQNAISISGSNEISNIPSNYQTDYFDVPLTFRIGISMDVVQTDLFRATAAIDATHPNDNNEYVNSGIELGYKETFFARIGYKSLFLRDSEQSIAAGAGINYNIVGAINIKVDYAYADYGRLSGVHFVSIGLKF
jgi:opacity protein-like surface antigen